jgi:non-heme chloroperoxidase
LREDGAVSPTTAAGTPARTGPGTANDYDTLADDLATLLERLDLHEVTLVAHSMGGGEVVRYLTRHGSQRVERIALIAATAPFPMKTEDNPGGIDRALMEADMATRTADRPKWFADNADGFFGVGLPGVSVSREFIQFMIGQCLDCSAQAAAEVFLIGFTTDRRAQATDRASGGHDSAALACAERR